MSKEFNQFSFEQLTADATVGGIALTPSVFEKVKRAIITVGDAKIRYRFDGGAPTATIGHVCDVDKSIELSSIEEIINFRAIRTGTTSAVLSITYIR
jgi:hypothetical protein